MIFSSPGVTLKGRVSDCFNIDQSFLPCIIDSGAIIEKCTGGTDSFGREIKYGALVMDCRCKWGNGFGYQTMAGTCLRCEGYGGGFFFSGFTSFTGICRDCTSDGEGCWTEYSSADMEGILVNCVDKYGGFSGVGTGGKIINCYNSTWGLVNA